MKPIVLVLSMLVPSLSFSETLELDDEIQLHTGTFEGIHGENKNKCFLEVTLVEDEELAEEGKEAEEDTTADGLYKIKVSFKYYKYEHMDSEWSFLIRKGSLEDSNLYDYGRITVEGATPAHHISANRLELLFDGDGYTKSNVTYTLINGPRSLACSFKRTSK
jgi:hypothetical protein